MQRPIVYVLLAVSLIGLTSAGYRYFRPAPVPPVTIRDQDTDSLVDVRSLQTEREYDLFVSDHASVTQDDSLTWYIQQVDPTGLIEKDFELNEPVREWKFQDTGYYQVQAYLDLKEVGRSMVHVIDGDRFQVDWGSEPEVVQGSSFQFSDRSTNVASRKWIVRRTITDEEIASSEEARFDWVAADTGTYVVRVKIETRSGKVERDEKTVRVVVAQPEPIADVKPVPAPPKPDPKPWKQKDPPAPVGDPNSSACFVSRKLEGNGFTVAVETPKREQIIKWSDEATVFTFSPKYDCVFTGFDYFSKAEIDDIEISIECENALCVGTASRSIRRKGAYDAHSFAHLDFQGLPTMNKDFKYKITIKAKAPGKLGFFPINTNIFKSQSSGQSYKGKDGSLTFRNQDMHTCIFNLRFTR